MEPQLQAQPKTTFSPGPIPTGLLQRACACGQHSGNGGECEECKKKREATLQRAAVSNAPQPEVPASVHEVLNSPGQPLDAATRSFMEPRFGHDFSRVPPGASQNKLVVNAPDDPYEREADTAAEKLVTAAPSERRQDFSKVRVHTDARAAESAQAVNALAYTVGNHVVFGAGQYRTDSPSGQRLLAHELTHVLQQNAHSLQRSLLQRQDRPAAPRTRVSLATEGSCSDPRAIAEAIPGALNMVWTAITWFLSVGARDRARVDRLLRANFNSDSSGVRDTVMDMLLSIRSHLQDAQAGRVTFVCTPNDANCGTFEGYVLSSERDRIHICPPFFGLTLEGRRWMMIHECAHLAGAMHQPEIYSAMFGPISEGNCLEPTALTSVNDALNNADNYARFIWCLTRPPGLTVTPTN